MPDRVVVEGGDRLAATLDRARSRLADTDAPDRRAAELVRRASQPPVLSGWLARSAVVRDTGDGVELAWTAVYAGVIHNGWTARNIKARPWTDQAVRSTERDRVEVYADHAQDALNTVTGK